METRKNRTDRGVGFFWSQHGKRLSPLVSLFFDEASAEKINRDALTWNAGLADRLWSAAGKVTLSAKFLKAFLDGMGTANLQLVIRLATSALERRNAETSRPGKKAA